ncbi:MAG: sterol 3beta-glucosyltransferase [Flavobacteriales bacterium]|jgi:sterol 3beta-glucosyltransferase
MKIGIQTYGSRGDINPWVALGQGLAREGHDVIVFYTNYTGGDFDHYSEQGLDVRSSRSLDPHTKAYDAIQDKPIYALDVLELTNYMVKEVFDQFSVEIDAAAEALCKDCELVISNPSLYQTSNIAEKRGVPRINVLVECQFSPTNRVSRFNDDDINGYFLEPINAHRAKLGLSPVSNARTESFSSTWLNLLAYSRVFATDEASWGSKYQLCGYFNLDNKGSHSIDSDLHHFLDAGDAPVFISMGSLAYFEGQNYEILDIFLEAIELSGCRAIIQADWKSYSRSIPSQLSNVYSLGYLPHELILPHCLGVIHHGGAGTSHAALMNACPSIVVAYAWDQFYWGRELMRLGTSPAMIKRKFLEPLQLAGAIKSLMLDEEYKERAQEAKRGMKREKGSKKAASVIVQAYRELEHDEAEAPA